jgi:hypothetical protein
MLFDAAHDKSEPLIQIGRVIELLGDASEGIKHRERPLAAATAGSS